MKLKDLKRGLAKFGADDDESHVILVTLNDKGEKEYNLLSFIAMIPTMNAIILGDNNSLEKLEKNGNLQLPDEEEDMSKE